jgi:membrane-bound lytic murein transglycosylase D
MTTFNRYLRLLTPLWGLFFSIVLPPTISTASSTTDQTTFPEFSIISKNVRFWEKIYSTYSVNTAIIHDQHHLNRIYAIISLHDEKLPGSRQKNEAIVKKTKKHYSRLLLKLSKKAPPASPEEKRVARLFGTSFSSSELHRAAQNIRSQRGLKERFKEGVIRSGAYMKKLKHLFGSQGLPTDLAYLPHVESSFNPKAYSKFGAAGMWQFTRTTGKEFLRIDYIIDERRDPMLAAVAAATFLKRNYVNLGTWPLALTAYNYGPAGMKRALIREGNYQNIFKNYREGYFKFASRNFYSEFLAAVTVAKKLERSGKLVLDRPIRYVSVKLPAYTDAIKLCRYLGIDPEVLKHYNPALREPVFQGTKFIPAHYIVKLPHHLKQTTLITRAPASLFKSEQKRSKFYQVRPGDTAGAIAMAHKIPLDRLIRVNNLNRKAMIRVGQNLRIPPLSTSGIAAQNVQVSPVTDPVLDDRKKSLVKGRELVYTEDSVVAGNLKVFNIQTNNQLISGTIEVQPEESLGIFADWLKVTARSIHTANNLSRNADIRPGERIILDFMTTSIQAFEETRFDFHQEIQEDFFSSYTIIGVKSYRVKEGDTIWDICHNKFGVPLWLLKKYNDKLDVDRLDSSSSLQIPILSEL